MNIGYPWFLLLLLLVPSLAVYYYHSRKGAEKARSDFSEPGMFALLGLGLADRRKKASFILIICAVALASIALARPLGPPSTDDEVNAGMDVIVALDISDSMGVQDIPGGRLAAAKEFVSKLVEAAPSNRYGLILFSGDAIVSCPLTLDHDAFLTFIDDADFPRADLPGTAIGEAVLSAATRFNKGELPRAVLVVTDGENTYGAEPVGAAGAAKGKGLKVYTVGVGTPSGGKIPAGADFFGNVQYKKDKQGRVVNSALDDAALNRVAGAGGGKYFSASEPGSVKSLAKELTVKTDKMLKDPFRGAKEYGGWFALAAGVLLMAAIIL